MNPSPSTRPDISVVLPCLDEAGAIGGCVDEALEGIRCSGLTGEVIVVDNGSDDGSPLLARRHGARVVYEPERGYGAALRAGFAVAAGRVVVMADADRTYDLSRLGELARPVLEGEADLVMGSRLEGLSRGPMPLLHRYLGTPALSLLMRRGNPGLKVRDSQSGYRAFSVEKMHRLGLHSVGFEFASEMLVRAAQAGWRIRELNGGYRERVGDSKLVTIADGRKHLRVIFLLSPQLLLIWPGVAAVFAGLALTAFSVAAPEGLVLGSLRWQPVFFMSILLVLGSLAILGGAVIDRYSPLTSERGWLVSAKEQTLFFSRWRRAGLVLIALGFGTDVVLFGMWVSTSGTPDGALALAGLAQSAIIVGATYAGLSIGHQLLARQNAYLESAVASSSASAELPGPAATAVGEPS